jgi:hypothetical protein
MCSAFYLLEKDDLRQVAFGEAELTGGTDSPGELASNPGN